MLLKNSKSLLSTRLGASGFQKFQKKAVALKNETPTVSPEIIMKAGSRIETIVKGQTVSLKNRVNGGRFGKKIDEEMNEPLILPKIFCI
jgi:hypothetical protein